MCKPEELNDPEIIQAMNTIDTMSLNTKERDYYESQKKVMRDEMSVIQTAVENAQQQTKIDTATEIAKEMKLSDEPIHKIIKFTGLTKEQIDKL